MPGLRLTDALRAAAACVLPAMRARCPPTLLENGDGPRPTAAVRLAHLADLQRRTLALCVFGGHTYRQAAIELGVPAGTTARLLISGLQDLVR